jgi:hypothetical protein
LLPTTQQEYMALLSYLRRHGHLHEGTTHANVRANHQYWITESADNHNQTTYWTGEQTWTDDNATYGHDWTDENYTTSHTFYEQDSGTEWGEADDESSGHSFASEPIDLSDVVHLPVHIAGEQLYLMYRQHKRRFRHFTRSGPRKFRGKGRYRKGKGKGSAGKSSRSPFPLFYADGTPFEPEEDTVFEVYYKGRGKGKKGAGSRIGRKNPIGKDGKVMLCSGCGSDEHFIKHCKNKGKGKGKGPSSSGKGISKAPSSSGFFEQASSDSAAYTSDNQQVQPLYLAAHLDGATTIQHQSRIIYYDGTSELVETDHTGATADVMQHENSVASRFLTFFAMLGRMLIYPFWPTSIAFHTNVRLIGKDREGLLVDSGAVSNLAGDRWVDRTAKIAAEHGQGTKTEARATQSVEGVGTGASTINQQATVPVCVSTGHVGSFKTAVVSDSDLPALMGLEGLERNRALIDISGRKLIYVGKGGYELKLSPNSIVMGLEKVPTGHLILPATEWNVKRIKAGPELAHFQC